MRPQSALFCLALLAVTVAFIAVQSREVTGQDTPVTNEAPASPVSSLELGSPYDLTSQQQFANELNADERQRLVMLRSRFALADTDFPVPANASEPFYAKLNADMTRELADRLTAAGAHFIGYANPHTHMLRADDAASLKAIRKILSNDSSLLGTLLQRPEDKLPASLLDLSEQGRLDGNYRVLFWRDVKTVDAALLLEASGAQVLDGGLDGASPMVTVRLSDAGARLLFASNWVEFVDAEGFKVSTNQTSAAMSNATQAIIGVNPYNLDGDGQVVGVWDGGVARETHEQYGGLSGVNAPAGWPGSSRVYDVNTTASMHYHAGHVTGTIVGNGTGNATAEGYAPKACALVHLWNNIDAERRDARHTWNHVADNHSYADFNGNSDDWGEYNGGTQQTDITNRDVLLCQVQSAGNYATSKPSGTYAKPFGTSNPTCSVPTYNAHRNGFIIAACDDSESLASFSSQGPAIDGRLVPQFCANGVSLTSSVVSADDAYQSLSGTSMSGPSVCGSVVLLSQLWRREHNDQMFTPDVARAVLAQTCRDKYNTGPDYRYGFGIVDCQAAADLILADKASGGDRIFRGTIRSGDVQEYSFNVSTNDPIHIVLSWLDIWASSGASVTLVNDLDVELVDPSSNVYYPYSGVTSASSGDNTYAFTNTGPNRRDNIELVHVDNPAQGNWTLRVRGQSIPANPQTGVPNDSTGFVVASSHAVSLQKLFLEDSVNGSTPVSIPDNSSTGITRSFTVNDPRIAVGVRLHARIYHERRGDLAVTLTSALGTTIQLKTTNNGVLDDETDIIAVFPDTKQSDDDVAAALHEYVQGTWTVKITDTVSGNTGTLNYLALELDLRTNAAPVADAGADFDVREQASGQLNGTGSNDSDGDNITYSWTQTSGAITLSLNNSTIAQPTFTAPSISQDEVCTFQLTVTDQSGDSDTDTVQVTVKNNLAPVADADADVILIESDNGQLDASGTSDPESDSISYSWTQTAGNITLTLSSTTAQQPTFSTTTPATQDETVTFELTATDTYGDSSTDTVDVTVEMNRPPVADAGPSFAVVWGASVQLDGTGSSDPNSTDVLSYAWVQTGGANTVTLSGAGTPQPSFTAPGVDDTLTFELTVTDLRNETSTASVTVWVNETGVAPVTSGGGDKGGGGCSTGGGDTWWFALLLCSILATLWWRRITRPAKAGD